MGFNLESKTNREVLRLEIQAELDSKKSALERNIMGQFATPTVLAREVLTYGLSLVPDHEKIRFLDPAVGTGSFFSALLSVINHHDVEAAKGFEIDPHYGLPSKDLWADTALNIEISDFTLAHPSLKNSNLLICNPPYVRHHHIDKDTKLRLQNECKETLGIKLSGLSGLYCYFMLLAHKWMADDGVAGWLIPSEFMDVNYGREIKRYLLEEVTLLRIHRFDPSDAQFEDALVSSSVVWFKNARPSLDHSVEFSYGGTHNAPSISKMVLSSELHKEPKWSRFPKSEARVANGLPIFSDLFTIKRGIATGANNFFIFNLEKIKKTGISMDFFRPILPSPRYLKCDEINADENGFPICDQQLFLLDCKLPENEVKEHHPALWNYLESGMKSVATGYLCNARTLWYKQEERSHTFFLCTYMGRGDNSSGRPFRFLLNHSNALVANTYLMIYPKKHVSEKLKEQPELVRRVWELLNEISSSDLISEGRVYGGGLHKMEPKELAKVPAIEIAQLLEL